jgi:perosamine synthetase
VLRRQLPVHSPIRALGLVSAFYSALTRKGASNEVLAAHLAREFGAHRVALTDSGTSALVLALRILVGEGRTVALPAYACVDLAAAAIRARVKVRLYDLDPTTLSPDLDSVLRVLKEGAAAVVVAHLYGFPGDVTGVMELARALGASVIEDAAQGAGGTLRGVRLGSFGPLTVLSFNRGKGITGGGGGALLAISPDFAEPVASANGPQHARRGWRELAIAASQWALGRPALYAIPSAMPGLRLGEMVYRPAHEPLGISAAAAALIRTGISLAEQEVAIRCRNAEVLMSAAETAEGIEAIRPPPGGTSGYLRFPVRDRRGRTEVRRLGILHGYPRVLLEQQELRSCLQPNERMPTGAVELSKSLFTLPVHSLVTRRDVQQLTSWLRSATALPHTSQDVTMEQMVM